MPRTRKSQASTILQYISTVHNDLRNSGEWLGRGGGCCRYSVLSEIEIVAERIGKQQFRIMAGMDENQNRVDTSVQICRECQGDKGKVREATEKREATRRKNEEAASPAAAHAQATTDNEDASDSKDFGRDSTQGASQPTQTPSRKGRSGG